MQDNIKWKARKRNCFGLPWSFTVYSYSDDRFFTKTGIFIEKEDQLQLYRIIDLELTRNLIQRIFSLGTISVYTSDATSGAFKIYNIKDADKVMNELSSLTEAARDKKLMFQKEYLGNQTAEDSIK